MTQEKKISVSISLSPEIVEYLKRFKAIAEFRHQNRSQIVTYIIEEFVKSDLSPIKAVTAAQDYAVENG